MAKHCKDIHGRDGLGPPKPKGRDPFAEADRREDECCSDCGARFGCDCHLHWCMDESGNVFNAIESTETLSLEENHE